MTDEEALLKKDIKAIMDIMVDYKIIDSDSIKTTPSDILNSRILQAVKSKTITIDSYIGTNYFPRGVGKYKFIIAPKDEFLTAADLDEYMFNLDDQDELTIERVTIHNGNGFHTLGTPLRIFYFYKLEARDYIKLVSYESQLKEVKQINGTLL